MVETVPLLIIFVVLLGFGLGFFGVIQTAIMNSMASRAYAFETFRNRADLTFFRDYVTGSTHYQYSNWGTRFHLVNDENVDPNTANSNQYATARPILFYKFDSLGLSPTSSSNGSLHNTKIYKTSLSSRYNQVGVSPAWIMVGYGICLNGKCGDG